VTELQAFNEGVAIATESVRVAARAVPPWHGLNSVALLGLADMIDGLKFEDPAPSAPAPK
jgi:hypothetical protein